MFNSKRIIARLDIKGNKLIKGVRFEGLRVIGEAKDFAFKYSETGIDELFYSDAVASLYGRNGLDFIVRETCKEIFVPKSPSFRIMDLVKAVSPSSEIEIIGIRPGEKIHEEMITAVDSFNTIDLGKYYAILPNEKNYLRDYQNSDIKYKKVPSQFSYNSFDNDDFLNLESIRELIKENIDKNFVPI